MSVRSFLASRLFVARCRLTRPSWWRLYQTALEHDKWSADQLAEFNFKMRLETLKFAYENTEYYHHLYQAAGLEPGDVKTEDDWIKVPILTREALRENFETLQIRNLKQRGRYEQWVTGGSTGQPSKVLKDCDFASQPLNWRASGWSGRKLFGKNFATLMRAHPMTFKDKIRQFLVHFPQKSLYLDTSSMNDESIRRFILDWKRYGLSSISGYTGGIHELALYCLNHKIEVPPLEAVFVTSSPCDLVQRKLIHKVFQAPVFDTYVATEAHPMANQCSCQAEIDQPAMHIHSDYRHLEFVDENARPMPTGELGDVLVTDMGDRVFPIVRYRLGDRGRSLPGKCPCGRPYPLMDTVHGRMADYIYLEKGKLSGEGWTMNFEHCIDAVHGFQIHQHADRSVTLRVILNKSNPAAKDQVAAVAAKMQAQLGCYPLSIEYVDVIPHDRGKLRYIISDVKGAVN